jgi:hypothetical protein
MCLQLRCVECGCLRYPKRNFRRLIPAPRLWTRHRNGSSECFGRGRERFRYCNMKCWPMSVQGQKRTSRRFGTMSAIPPKAAILVFKRFYRFLTINLRFNLQGGWPNSCNVLGVPAGRGALPHAMYAKKGL